MTAPFASGKGPSSAVLFQKASLYCQVPVPVRVDVTLKHVPGGTSMTSYSYWVMLLIPVLSCSLIKQLDTLTTSIILLGT
jgi:hypothetical protein